MPRRTHHRRRPQTRTPDERAGRVFEVTIERIVPGGFGLAHADGVTLLVALAAPGDQVEVEVESARGKALFARIRRILEPAAARVAPPCHYFGSPHRCGGCDFQQLAYDAQLAAKREMILDALRRTGGIRDAPPFEVMPAPRAWAYRSRAEWQHDGGRFGYYERGTHNICDVTHCPVVAPEIERALEGLRSEMEQGRLPQDVGEFRAMAGDNETVAVAHSLAPFPSGELQRTIRGETYRFDAECFFQINHDLLPALVAEALRPVEAMNESSGASANAHHAVAASNDFALDLYCGVGLFTVPLARRFNRVIGVEAHTASARYGARNLQAANLSHAHIETLPVADWLARNEASLPPVDFALLDPPRAGAEAVTIAALNRLRPARIAYVSCDPVTLARDLRSLIAGGYELESLRAFDLFPQTHHVETIAHLVSKG